VHYYDKYGPDADIKRRPSIYNKFNFLWLWWGGYHKEIHCMAELLDSVKNNTRKTTSREKNFLELYTTSIALFNNALQELWGDEYFENVDNHSDDNQE